LAQSTLDRLADPALGVVAGDQDGDEQRYLLGRSS
jgi:hypothetical protein